MFKKTLVVCIAVGLFVLSACKKNDVSTNQLDASIVQKIKALGFDTSRIIPMGKGFIVENDIYLSRTYLDSKVPSSPVIQIAKTEQYRTYNIVTGLPRVIKVALDGSANTVFFQQAVDEAIARFNDLGYQLTFQRVSTGQDILVKGYYEVSTSLGYAGDGVNDATGFPDVNGNPASVININTYYISTVNSVGYTASIIQHEIGHTIGFRHTDYFNRASCGINVAEPVNPLGAVQIPGTPSGADYRSWMEACHAGTGSSTFSQYDMFALAYLFTANGDPGAQPITDFYHAANSDHAFTPNQNFNYFYSGWVNNGRVFRAFLKPATGRIPVYEYYNSSLKDHCLSLTANDPSILQYPNWSMTGLIFYVYSTPVAGSVPIYTYYSSVGTNHYYTKVSNFQTIMPEYRNDGVVFYAAP
ncbi:dual-action HEIGH metallo-peptidase [Chitinophaga skermanii]|uniref:Dual-action HEIGH metallo-peptidase n=1 Tax=Chitinophaga skermanii TaxID=331697 RepID=A0A327R307_9BACT|nr:M57 family metalloprotease [Chitinophaga skermanii]RAJ11090.1 dual-action HEIGH metallo-peptidase [Chitinophaga skermanii]